MEDGAQIVRLAAETEDGLLLAVRLVAREGQPISVYIDHGFPHRLPYGPNGRQGYPNSLDSIKAGELRLYGMAEGPRYAFMEASTLAAQMTARLLNEPSTQWAIHYAHKGFWRNMEREHFIRLPHVEAALKEGDGK